MFQRLTTLAKALVAEQFDGKAWAYAAVCIEAGVFGLGICVRDEPGYYPVPSWICCGATLNAAQNYADELNRDREFTLDQAAAVVSSSMRAGRIRA